MNNVTTTQKKKFILGHLSKKKVNTDYSSYTLSPSLHTFEDTLLNPSTSSPDPRWVQRFVSLCFFLSLPGSHLVLLFFHDNSISLPPFLFHISFPCLYCFPFAIVWIPGGCARQSGGEGHVPSVSMRLALWEFENSLFFLVFLIFFPCEIGDRKYLIFCVHWEAWRWLCSVCLRVWLVCGLLCIYACV